MNASASDVPSVLYRDGVEYKKVFDAYIDRHERVGFFMDPKPTEDLRGRVFELRIVNEDTLDKIEVTERESRDTYAVSGYKYTFRLVADVSPRQPL